MWRLPTWLACAGKAVEETLEELREAGLGSLPGGGAEVFSPAGYASVPAPKNFPVQTGSRSPKTAHRHGFNTNATMLYGHIETIEERLEHLEALRSGPG